MVNTASWKTSIFEFQTSYQRAIRSVCHHLASIGVSVLLVSLLTTISYLTLKEVYAHQGQPPRQEYLRRITIDCFCTAPLICLYGLSAVRAIISFTSITFLLRIFKPVVAWRIRQALGAMPSDGISLVPTPRQYRPTYTKLSSSVSTSNFGSPLPRATIQPPINTKRRRATSNFPTIDHLHSAPTVASSGLTASVFSNDISNPTPKPHRLSLHARSRTPIRIPTPVPHTKIFSPVRSASSPVAPQKTKENMLLTTHRLLGPIPPGPPPNSTLTKSRTMNVLSNLTSTFTRSTHSLASSRSSCSNLSTHTLPPPTSHLPIPASTTTNMRQIYTSMPTAYWLGRYLALHDRFRSDYLVPSFLSSPSKRAYWTSIPDDVPNTDYEPSSNSRGEERLVKHVFTHLDALCMTSEARKSLKTFQQAYARKVGCEALLPLGGCMADRQGGFIARAGRLFGGVSGSGGGGRKSSFGVARRKSTPLTGMSFTVEGDGA